MNETDQKVFVATVQKEGSFTFVAIPFSPREVWGARPRYPVLGTINDIAVRGTLGAAEEYFRLGQDYFLRLSAKWLRDSGIEPGASVTVILAIVEPQKIPSVIQVAYEYGFTEIDGTQPIWCFSPRG